jgi:hypothetical protein
MPKATSTGTTIVGCLFKDGVVLGADTRATEGDIVADKNCEKVNTIIGHHTPTSSDSWVNPTARSTTLPLIFAVVAPVQRQIPNSLPH